jgi:hypothetical protein
MRLTEFLNEIQLLNELQLPRSPEFYQWFKGSKVVDAEGNPLPVFHSTESEVPFQTPRPWSHFGTAEAAYDRVIPGPMIHDELRRAKTGLLRPLRTIPVYLKITNPLEVEDPNDQHDEQVWMSLLWNTGKFKNVRRLETAEMNGEERFYQEATSFLLAHGYDGIFYKNKAEDPGSISWVPIHGDQIRTAITESINESIKDDWGSGWHNIHTGKNVYEPKLPHSSVVHANKEEFGDEVVNNVYEGEYSYVYDKGWVRYFWAFDDEKSFMEFTSNADNLKQAMPWIIDLATKHKVEIISISNNYSTETTEVKKRLVLVDGDYVPEEQVNR